MRRFLTFVGALILSSTLHAQEPVTGIPPFSSIHSGGLDAINRQNLNVNLSFPIVALPGRGESFSFAVVNDSLIWKIVTIGSVTSWTRVTDKNGNPTYGWLKEAAVGQTLYTYSVLACYDFDLGGYEYFDKYSNYAYYDARGTKHPFTVSTIVNCFTPGTSVGFATDGSGYKIDITSPTAPRVWSKSGDEMTVTNGYVLDNNGNKTSFSVSGAVTTWTDTAGHAALVVDKTNANYIEYRYQDSAGSPQVLRLNLHATAQNIKTNFGCYGVNEFNGTERLPVDLVLPNGRKYEFFYEETPGFQGQNPPYYTGRLRKIILPTGGYVEYVYPSGPTDNNGINCADGTVKKLTRIVSAGEATPPQTVFTRTQVGADWKTNVDFPPVDYGTGGTVVSVSTFAFNTSRQLLSEKHYHTSDIAANQLREINTTWAANGTPSSTTIILKDVTPNQHAKTDTTFDSYGSLTQSIEYAWGSGAPGSPVRTMQITYLGGTNYTSRNILNRPTQVLVRDGGIGGAIKSRTVIAYDEAGYINLDPGGELCGTVVVQHDGTNFGCTFVYRGLPTTVTTYTNAAAQTGPIARHSFFDKLGNLRKADVNCCQQKEWAFTSATNYAFPASVTSGPSGGPQLTASATYNAYTGQVVSATDENSQVTSFAYDSLKRVDLVTRPDMKTIDYAYDSALAWATVSLPVQGSDRVVQKTEFDTLGRPFKRSVMNGAESVTYSKVESQFDALGRAYKQSNPYAPPVTPSHWTETRFDALGRPAKVIAPGGAETTYSYSGNTATVTDPSGKQRKSETDALGRLATLSEPDVNNGNQLTQNTAYAHNVLDLLTQVNQGVQTRTYNYDDLGRLTSQTTPEAGNWSYLYNAFSQVTQRTDARGVDTIYTYDGLNRLTGVSYDVSGTTVPATAPVTYSYGTDAAQNNKGRLISVFADAGGTANDVTDSFTYDLLGQVTQVTKNIGGTNYPATYAYNLAGELTAITYPSGRVVNQEYDTIGRLSAVKNGTSPMADAFAYNSAGQVTGFRYNNDATFTAAFGYSADRLQLTSLTYTKSSQKLLELTYAYGASGSNNGQITGITDTSDQTLTPGAAGRSVNYTYDALHRLKTAVTTGSTQYPQWGLEWIYDRYGNRTEQRVTAGSAPPHLPTMDPATNRIVEDANHTYDQNGNMTKDGVNTLAYDAANRVIAAAAATYTYDGGALRVKKVSGATTTVYVFSGTKVIAEYDNGAAVGSPTREYIYAGSQLLAKIEGGATTYFHPDHLSARVMTNTSGTITAQSGHYPFGENWYETASNKLKFTSYARDTASGESGNDYAIFRSHISRLGRFSSPDPLAGSIGNPQSLNRYAYTANDPVGLADPLGLTFEQGCWEASCGGGSSGITEGAGNYWNDSDGHWPADLDCGVDPFCRANPPGPFGSPVANGGSWVGSTGLAGGSYRLVSPLPPGTLVLICDGKSTSFMDCFWSPDSIRYVLNGNLVWMVRGGVGTLDLPLSDSAKQILGDVYEQAGAATDAKGIAIWYGTALVAGAIPAILADYALGTTGSVLFGRFHPMLGGGFAGFLNSNPWLRVGYGWNANTQEQVFRVSGSIAEWLSSSGHFDLWRVPPH